MSQLGEALNFEEAVAPALRLINLFKQFPSDFLHELPPNQQNQIRSFADGTYNIFKQILDFDAKSGDPYASRTAIIAQITTSYQPTFDQLQTLISYGASRSRDFEAMARDFRATIQKSVDEANSLTEKLAAQDEDAKRILDEVRKVAAEQGVSQQAKYFQEESISHDQQSIKWRNWTIVTASALGIYAVLSVFIHKWPLLAPANTYEAIQLGLSKVLIFAVLAYMLLLCSRNFLTHTHNGIVNKHRQNALLTFNALVEAAGNDERRDVILTYAAACIFSPQETGYIKGGSGGAEMPLSIIQALPKLVSATAQH